jgi:hypothetical protein
VAVARAGRPGSRWSGLAIAPTIATCPWCRPIGCTARSRSPRAEFGGLRDVRLELDATAVARQDRVDPLADLAPPPAGYVVVGGELAATLPTSREPIRLALSGANLTSTRHREYTSLNRYFVDQPGWQLSLRLTAHFDSPTSAR